jgi:hypothetical protein
MGMQEQYDDLMKRIDKSFENHVHNVEENNLLYIHGTYIRKFPSIWKEGIKTSGEVPNNWGHIHAGNNVSLQKTSGCSQSGHGNITLVIDGNKLNPEKMEYHEGHGHEIYPEIISREAILAVMVPKKRQARKIHRITKNSIPVILNWPNKLVDY